MKITTMFQSRKNESHIQHNRAEGSALGSQSNHFATPRHRELLKIPSIQGTSQNPADRSMVDHDILEA